MVSSTVRAGCCAALLLALTLAGCKGEAAKAEAAAAPPADSAATRPSGAPLTLPVVGDVVRQGDLVLTVTTTGQVRSDAVSRLRAETGGTVERVLVIPGQRVARGQPLVRLDPRPFDLAVAEAQALVDQAEIQYLDNIVPDSIVSGKPPSEERRRNALARSGLATSRVRLDKVKLDRERATILAPFDGIVERVDVAAGERVGANQDVATVVDIANLRIEAAVLEHDLGLIRVGGEALVSTAAAPDQPMAGRIMAVLPLVDSTTRAGRAIVRVRSAQGAHGRALLQPGMYADVRLEATRLGGRTLVPTSAVIERDGRPLVFVVKDGRAQWVYVTPGRSNGRETEVLPDSATGQLPLAVGDTVLIEGHLTLTHDAPVKVTARKSAGEE
jgi:RND family efflux transporter MFP subunit